MLNGISSVLGPLCAFGSSVAWAIGSTGYSKLSRQYSVFAVNFTRALVAFPLFFISAFVIAGGLEQGLGGFQAVKLPHLGWFALSMVASYGLGDSIFLWSTNLLGVPAALAIASCYPIWTVFAQYWLDGKIVSHLQLLGLVIALVGIIIVILNNKNHSQVKTSKWAPLGVLLAIGTSLSWAINSVAVSRIGTDLSLPVANSIRMAMALFLNWIFGMFLGPILYRQATRIFLPLKEILSSFWFFILEAFLGSAFFFYGLTHSPLAVGATLTALAPVISVPVALLFGLEKFSLYKSLGVCLVVLGVWFLI